MSRAPASVTPLAQQGGGHPIEPGFSSFARRYDEGVPQVAWTRLVADLETPVSAMLKLAHERPKAFFWSWWREAPRVAAILSLAASQI